ncbi:GNAT family N-acetyltransferase [Alicyclobacillus sp. SO9]|uniref:GNAT family N-acetyltransferase n=1 Tax=Alicyclobacillus sp. SO9 TaxID=2665646 RepID=UPI001E57F81D|nr:GNAT family N-acetyltransferase [Alicyclobacillus sp. SO9]
MEHTPQDTELLWLFVDPSLIGGGYGKKLWIHAVQTAWADGYKSIRIKSDPFAEGFYLKQGAQRVGEIPSTVQPDFMFPLLYLNREA